jgi:hypothetical protein
MVESYAKITLQRITKALFFNVLKNVNGRLHGRMVNLMAIVVSDKLNQGLG